jgi:hypothetical protein
MNEKKNWAEHYRKIFEEALDTTEVKELVDARDKAKAGRDRLTKKIKEIDGEIAELQGKRKELIAAGADGEEISESVEEAVGISNRVAALKEIKSSVETRVPEQEDLLRRRQVALKSHAEGILKRVRFEEQAGFDDVMDELIGRYNAFREAANNGNNKITARADSFFFGRVISFERIAKFLNL